jgi:hypothetical protein
VQDDVDAIGGMDIAALAAWIRDINDKISVSEASGDGIADENSSLSVEELTELLSVAQLRIVALEAVASSNTGSSSDNGSPSSAVGGGGGDDTSTLPLGSLVAIICVLVVVLAIVALVVRHKHSAPAANPTGVVVDSLKPGSFDNPTYEGIPPVATSHDATTGYMDVDATA